MTPRSLGLLAVSLGLLPGCSGPTVSSDHGSARLSVVPGPPTATIPTGLSTISFPGKEGRAGYLLVPDSYHPDNPLPLVVAFHGAGIAADGPISLLRSYAEERGFLLVSVESQGSTWDTIYRPYGPDLATVDYLLQYVFDHCAVDASRMTIEGFSDGGSYALGVGLANGDLFSRILAFSPGFIPSTTSPDIGRPAVFLSHGRQDNVLPIEGASRFIASQLSFAGYEVTLVEFDGGHTVPASILAEAMQWMLPP